MLVLVVLSLQRNSETTGFSQATSLLRESGPWFFQLMCPVSLVLTPKGQPQGCHFREMIRGRHFLVGAMFFFCPGAEP